IDAELKTDLVGEDRLGDVAPSVGPRIHGVTLRPNAFVGRAGGIGAELAGVALSSSSAGTCTLLPETRKLVGASSGRASTKPCTIEAPDFSASSSCQPSSMPSTTVRMPWPSKL